MHVGISTFRCSLCQAQGFTAHTQSLRAHLKQFAHLHPLQLFLLTLLGLLPTFKSPLGGLGNVVGKATWSSLAFLLPHLQHPASFVTPLFTWSANASFLFFLLLSFSSPSGATLGRQVQDKTATSTRGRSVGRQYF